MLLYRPKETPNAHAQLLYFFEKSCWGKELLPCTFLDEVKEKYSAPAVSVPFYLCRQHRFHPRAGEKRIFCAGILWWRGWQRIGFIPEYRVQDEDRLRIYYSDQEITIRSLQPEDADTIAAEEAAQAGLMPVHKNIISACKTKRTARQLPLAAELLWTDCRLYQTYNFRLEQGLLPIRGTPEIVDFGVLEKYRCRGIGSKPMDVAEQLAGEYSRHSLSGESDFSGYGSATAPVYQTRSYLPDGSGVWYKDVVWAALFQLLQ